MDALPVLEWPDLALRLVAAALLGGAIGFERELHERRAGLRTHMLVSLGAALFTVSSAYAWSGFVLAPGAASDQSRIAAGIVAGIGFIGAGAIIRQGVFVRGLTTAASLWVAAAIGLASGLGYFTAALVATVVVLVSLGPLRWLADRLFERFRLEEANVVLELRPEEEAPDVLEALESMGAGVEAVEIDESRGRRLLDVDLRFRRGGRMRGLAEIRRSQRVVKVRWQQLR
ncbi:MAG TPA: MgtC/SapB family protein [Gaiellaceae bacterium]|nr:MgtC/SapB family protein [Gaiellaceae bacterium]